MIVVRVELWSAITGQKSEIGRMVVDNIGGTVQHGDYRCRTYRGRDECALDRAMIEGGKSNITREGRVTNHASLKEHVWNLIAKSLSSMGYGQ